MTYRCPTLLPYLLLAFAGIIVVLISSDSGAPTNPSSQQRAWQYLIEGAIALPFVVAAAWYRVYAVVVESGAVTVGAFKKNTFLLRDIVDVDIPRKHVQLHNLETSSRGKRRGVITLSSGRQFFITPWLMNFTDVMERLRDDSRSARSLPPE